MVEAVTIYHMVIEGMLALTGQHFIIDYNERKGTQPGFVEGFTNVARDEHRHVAFGARFLRDMARRDPRYAQAVHRTLAEAVPVAERAMRPPRRAALTNHQSAETFARQALTRRLKAIGLG